MASPLESQDEPGNSFETASVNSGTSFLGGSPVIHSHPHVEGGDAAFHMLKNVYIYGANSPITADDVCQSLKAMLQASYKNIRFPKMPWIDWNYEFPLEHYFVDLTVTEKGDELRKSPAKEMKFQEIFNEVKRKTSTRILIEGPAGYGKSTLALKLCHDFAKGEEYISQFQVVVLIRLREFKDGKINEMLAKKLNLQDHTPELILNSIMKNQKSVLIILDGYDEAEQKTRDNLQLLLKSECLPEASVIVTGRPGAVLSMDDFDKRIEIKGITGTKRRQFIELHLQNCNEEQRIFLKEFLRTNFDVTFGFGLADVIHRVQKFFSSSEEKENFFNCPLFLLLVVSVAKHSFPKITSFSSKTDLYKKLFNFVVQRTLGERIQTEEKVDLFEHDSTNPPSCATCLSQFGKLALNALTAKQFTFTREAILSSCDGNDIILQMGLLTENEYTENGKQSTWYEPIHLSILEFCAAYHLWFEFKRQLVGFDFPIEMLPGLSGRVEFFVFPFFLGLCGNFLESFFSALTQVSNIPLDLLRRFSRCESITSESTLEPEQLINALLLLVPKVWKTSWFTDGKYTATKLLKETVTEALIQGRLECIVHDADLNWNITLGKLRPGINSQLAHIPMFALAINSSQGSVRRTYENVGCLEVRVFLGSVTNLRAISTEWMYTLSLVEEESSKQVTSHAIKQIHDGRDFFMLKPLTSHDLKVVGSKDESLIGTKVALYERICKEKSNYNYFYNDTFYEKATDRLLGVF